ncbi:hypothetical protein [Streptomyces sp. NPDC048385]|uniref:hypothetical protein n=1 Tax=unclassified Streptomyces TaxID=2593676 RepID=UPI003416E8C8
MNGAPGSGQSLGLDTLVRLKRDRRSSSADGAGGHGSFPLPEGMTAPLGRDAVAVPARLGRLVVSRLPRVGCVFADGTRWWWIVPSDSDDALTWPAPALYGPGAPLPGTARLIHRPDGTLPYTPPIPLYVTLCRVTGTTPQWSRPLSA